MGIRTLLFGSRRFTPQDLFRNSEPGFHGEVYDPNTLLRRRNRFTYSAQFDNAAWTKASMTVSANADGTADKLIPAAAAAVHTISEANCSVGVSNIVRARAKPDGYSWVYVTIGTVTTWFNVTTGAVGTTGAGMTPTIAAAADAAGYYDCTVYAVAASTACLIGVSAADGTASFTGDGTSGVLLARADLRWNATSITDSYQEVTDWNTEFLAAAGSANVGMYQDSAGTTATWGVEQPVGRWVDWRLGKGVAGNNATQATGASRPTLSARVNLRIKSEQMDDAAWTKTDVTPTANQTADPVTGLSTADLLTEGSAGTARTSQSATIVASAPWTERISLKRGNTDWVLFSVTTSDFTTAGFRVWVNLATGAKGTEGVVGTGTLTSATIDAQANGFYAVTLKGLLAANTTAVTSVHSASADAGTTRVNGATYYAWGSDGRYSDDAAKNIPAYQRVNVATTGDYDTDGFPHYLYFVTDDSYATPSIDFSGVENVRVWAGQTKLSDAATGMLLELSSSSAAGTFSLFMPTAAAQTNYRWRSFGSVANADSTATGYAAPNTAVLAAQGQISTDTAALRVNGAAPSTSATDQGAGNYLNAALYIGRRGGASVPFNGRLTSLTVRGTTTPTSDRFLRQMEQYAARLAGQSFAST